MLAVSLRSHIGDEGSNLEDPEISKACELALLNSG